MNDWSLPKLLASLHKDVEGKLSIARDSLSHPSAKGKGSENAWLSLLQTYLPKRYRVTEAFAVDSKGNFSDQIDVVVYDRQYSPLVFKYEGQTIIPAESVYAAFEVKQTLNAKNIRYAQGKISSVRKLYRTSLPVPHVDGVSIRKHLPPITGGILTLDSEWNPPLGCSLEKCLGTNDNTSLLNFGCAAKHGYFFQSSEKDKVQIFPGCKSSTAFLFKLISDLQMKATVPMINIQAYGAWLDRE